MKPRLDEILVERGYFEDLHAAQVAVLAGEIVVGEHRETNAGKRLDADVAIRRKGQSGFVSRGGKKLAGALAVFDINPQGLNCADLGASSGGFTDCLLQAGASHVSAVDVNYGQFAWSLRCDERVSLFERTNVRGIDVKAVGGPFELVVGDLSFISLRTIMPDLANLVAPCGQMVMLVKPQFEAERHEVGAGGVIRDEAVHHSVLAKVTGCAQEHGLCIKGLSHSPIKGPKGNIEFLLWAVKPSTADEQGVTIGDEEIERIIQTAYECLGGIR